MFDAVSVVIPGARTPEQSRANAGASDLPPLSPETMAKLRAIYEPTSNLTFISVGRPCAATSERYEARCWQPVPSGSSRRARGI
jgi:diketogulonate reductase-like aldo/keto reductase